MEFEFNFGQQQISRPQNLDNTLYASVDGAAIQLSEEELVFLQKSTGLNHVMTMQVLQAMSLTQQFKPMHEHIATLSESLPELKGQTAAIQKVLELMKQKELLISADDWLTQLQTTNHTTPSIKYAGMVVRTCNRSDQLSRLLESLQQYQEQHSVQHSVLVFDDSADSKQQQLNEQICRQAKGNVQYFGQSWQQQFIAMLLKEFPQHSREITWLLAEHDGFTGGRVWNLALLSLAGKKFSFYDDDYLIQPRGIADADDKHLSLLEKDQLSVGFGLNIRDIKEASFEISDDLLAAMVDACGQPFAQWLSEKQKLQTSSLYGLRLLDLQHLNSNSIIKSTCNGTWGSPRAESNYWLYLLQGKQREAFWQSRETYLDNIEASHLLHYSDCYQAMQLAYFAPSTIDNSDLTPFSMPFNKNEDHFFNAMMSGCYPSQVSLHFPQMMGHIQDRKRNRSGFNHIAKRPNFNSFVADYVQSIAGRFYSPEPQSRYQTLAAYINDLATSGDQELLNRLQEYLTKTRADMVFSLQQIIEQVPDAPIYWQADVRELLTANGKAVKSNQVPILNDWDATMDSEACIAKARHDLKEVVDAMYVWPKLWTFCKAQ